MNHLNGTCSRCREEGDLNAFGMCEPCYVGFRRQNLDAQLAELDGKIYEEIGKKDTDYGWLA